MGPITETVYNRFQDTGAIMPEMVEPMDTIMDVWQWFPIIVLFGMVLWAISITRRGITDDLHNTKHPEKQGGV
ncbi:MAG: hypothetical protein JRC90_10170 [Deltaproteobacteria bacterium]|nr:hypothetical protein [Deltaproteobacteria bacterium]